MTVCAAAFVMPSDAEACGGCFVANESTSGQSENTIVTGHRMAISISKTQSVLWDQIEYDGDPAEFSWVLPVKPGASIELAHDAFFEVLDAGTATTVNLPSFNCSQTFGGGNGSMGGPGGGSDDFGCGCSGDDAAFGAPSDSGGDFAYDDGNDVDLEAPPPPDVTVVSKATVGPYDTVTLSTDVPGVLNDWLIDNGYAVPEEMEPIIDAYVADGFDFIALRLVPDVGVGAMSPVRIVMPGPSLTLPLRMVAAGTGAQTALSLFIIAEGRYEAANFANVSVHTQDITWDFDTSSSNYAELRLDALSEEDGRAWLAPYAKQGPFFSPQPNFLDDESEYVSYAGEGWSALTLAEAYVRQASGNMAEACTQQMNAAASLEGLVVENCDEKGQCFEVDKGEIPADALRCDGIDDIAVAFTGQHLQDVWLTRIDALLPRAALSNDLILTAAMGQLATENRLVPNVGAAQACATVGAQPAALLPLNKMLFRPKRKLPGGLVALFLAATAGIAMFRRRRD
jgi:hypothetical protein